MQINNELKAVFYDRIRNLYGKDAEYLDDVYEIVSPSSTTQSTDVFLRKVVEDIEAGDIPSIRVVEKYDKILDKITLYNSEYQILCDTWQSLKESVESSVLNANDVRNILLKNDTVKSKIKKQALENFSEFIANKDAEISVLLPSVSSQVIDYLSGLPSEAMKRITLYISVATPKIPTNVNDTLVKLREAICSNEIPFKSITVIPDSVALNMISRAEIDLVLYGASRILTADGKPFWLTNSCGTEAILLMARERNVDVHLVCPNSKYEEVQRDENGNLSFTMFYIDEPGTFDIYVNESGWEVEKRNTRRDFSKIYKNVLVVNENQSFYVMDDAPSIIVRDAQNKFKNVTK